MGIEHVWYGSTLIHYSTVDAVFRNEADEPISMSFHPFCGPAFEDADQAPIYPDEDDPLWEQFNGWWVAKGRALHHKEPGPDAELIDLGPLGMK